MSVAVLQLVIERAGDELAFLEVDGDRATAGRLVTAVGVQDGTDGVAEAEVPAGSCILGDGVRRVVEDAGVRRVSTKDPGG